MKREIQTACIKQNLKEIRSFVANFLLQTRLTEVEINALVLAVDEVCANVIIHSTQNQNNQTLEVCVELKPNEIKFEVLDKGKGYDIRKHEMPVLKEIIKSKRKGGVGLLLVQKIMDEIDFIPQTNGNIIRLIKHI